MEKEKEKREGGEGETDRQTDRETGRQTEN